MPFVWRSRRLRHEAAVIIDVDDRELETPLDPFWWAGHFDLLLSHLRSVRGRSGRFDYRRRVDFLRAACRRTIRGAKLGDAYPSLRLGGRLVCARCMGRLPPGHRRWCSPECRTDAEVRCNPGLAREHVRERDRGVCGRCGRDTAGPRSARKRMRSEIESRGRCFWRENDESHLWWIRVGRGLRRASITLREHTWEMEHVIPVVEGGGLCGLDGLVTLCIPCHRESTAELAARRARAGRAQMEIGFGG